MGDSITSANQMHTTPVMSHTPHGFWTWAAPILGQRMDVIQAGIQGQSSYEMLARFQTDVINTNASWLHLLAGTNDVVRFWNFGGNAIDSLSSTQANITAMLDMAQAAGMRTVIGTIPPNNNLATTYNGPAWHLGRLNEWIRGLATTRKGVIVVDYFAALVDATGFQYVTGATEAIDGTHPNGLGASRMGKTLAAALAPLVAPRNVLPASNLDLPGYYLVDNLSLGPTIFTGTGGTLGGGATGTVSDVGRQRHLRVNGRRCLLHRAPHGRHPRQLAEAGHHLWGGQTFQCQLLYRYSLESRGLGLRCSRNHGRSRLDQRANHPNAHQRPGRIMGGHRGYGRLRVGQHDPASVAARDAAERVGCPAHPDDGPTCWHSARHHRGHRKTGRQLLRLPRRLPPRHDLNKPVVSLPMQGRAVTATCMSAALLVGLAIPAVATRIVSPTAILVAAAALAASGAVAGVHRSRAAGQFDPFHPLLFPSLYVAFACLAPTLWVWGLNRPLGFVSKSLMSPETPAIMALSVAGFVIGAAIPFARRVAKKVERNSRVLARTGHVLLAASLLLNIRDYLSGAVLNRGLGQNTVTLAGSIGVLGFLVGCAAIALMLTARLQQGKSLLGRAEWTAVLALIGFLGLSGKRANALAIMITILVYLTRKKGANFRAIVGLAATALFASIVLSYRTAANNTIDSLGAVAALLRDLGSIPFTTGVTAQAIGHSYLGGSTIIAGLLRQIPSPIANNLFGQPADTGAFQFRTISGMGNDSLGYGFSLPAEGYLNFGLVGAFALMLVVGAALAWFYARFDTDGTKATQFVYVIFVASLPFALRSDVLGLVKGVLYPSIIFAGTLLLARSVHRFHARRTPVHIKSLVRT